MCTTKTSIWQELGNIGNLKGCGCGCNQLSGAGLPDFSNMDFGLNDFDFRDVDVDKVRQEAENMKQLDKAKTFSIHPTSSTQQPASNTQQLTSSINPLFIVGGLALAASGYFLFK